MRYLVPSCLFYVIIIYGTYYEPGWTQLATRSTPFERILEQP